MKIFAYITIAWLSFNSVVAQSSRLSAGLEAQAGLTSDATVPFWLRSNQFGSIPLNGPSISLIGRAQVNYDSTKSSLLKWKTGVEGRFNVGKEHNFTLIQGYAGVKIGIFELQAGRTRDVVGLVDTTLSSGAFSISGNALGIPKVQFAIPDFYELPFANGLLAFKGSLAHGWLGEIPLQYGRIKSAKTQFHHKSFYGRIGGKNWRMKLYAGFNHQVFFGNESRIWANFDLSAAQTYKHVVLGKAWNYSKVGNHMGSMDAAIDYDTDKMKFLLYHQFFYEVGGLAHLSNLRDGLTGFSVTNKKKPSEQFIISKGLLEFFFSRNQGGESWSPITPSGDEDYYNNYLYTQGWSYKGLGLGNPLITTTNDLREGLPRYPTDYFTNNRVVALHLSLVISNLLWQFHTRLTYTNNYGTFGTSENGHTAGERHTPPIYGIFPQTPQFMGYVKIVRNLRKDTILSLTIAADSGKLLHASQGMFLTAAKAFR
ncbi:capsule assembly Wzi family protein [Dyadobacter fanqingshengii]|uniref:Capsule assembly Wzi family protein n=1 Tax=Dyadobacter fanqingshengii TaxID=2906443 RepID=A0A9X1PFW6_9BACT|nr:capsule assembly Wzi family protein [Dyadobacter fanqingshengii]MCF0042522.1 capsule assembly Wzi family protein [Dyadobacter fanqingshengii]USJ36250.1 capsule assembly Wzi family protein [Dyadobacter fanqingshengii]